ncbi:hypothetical protein [Stenotrophomonas sp. TWI819]|uniref:hypothetical protein n=1 Tax=Stenotrophomonas sp. TWI819 TaxID=3136800 RepID=UPI0031C14885
MRISGIRGLVGIVILASMPMVGLAQSDNHGSPLAKRGLGQAQPLAANVSQDANWLVYGFEREGITYFQVNDLAGRVHVIIGNADDVFWVLPAGDVAAKVSLPAQRIQLPRNARRSEVYRGARFSLVRYGNGSDAVWSVEPVGGGR